MIELSCLLETCYETEISCTDVVSNEKIKTIMRQLHRLRAPPAPEIRCGTAPAGAAPAWPLAGSSGIFVMDVIALITIRPKGRMYIHCINICQLPKSANHSEARCQRMGVQIYTDRTWQYLTLRQRNSKMKRETQNTYPR